MPSVRIDRLEGGAISVRTTPSSSRSSRADLQAHLHRGAGRHRGRCRPGCARRGRVRFLGRKAELVLLLRSIPELPPGAEARGGQGRQPHPQGARGRVEARRQALETEELVHGLGEGPRGRHSARLAVARWGICIWSRRPSGRSRTSSSAWATRSPTGRRSRPSTTTSRRSTRRPTTRPARCTTRSS